MQILDYVRDQARVPTRDAVREHGTSPNPLNSTFGFLVDKGLLQKHEAGPLYLLRTSLTVLDPSSDKLNPHEGVGLKVLATATRFSRPTFPFYTLNSSEVLPLQHILIFGRKILKTQQDPLP